MDYQVDLDIFRGPLDLLLYLVKRHEVDICDIPIAKVAQQFADYLLVLKTIDVERAGDFIVMASTLMEIKSKLLLPRPEEEAGEQEDPRQELVRQLLEYKKFKEAATLLEAQAEKQNARVARAAVPVASSANPAQQPLQEVELWDLVSAFGRLMRETMAQQPQQIVMDYTPIQVYMDQIVARLEKEGTLLFSQVFVPPWTRGRLTGMFLAVLELVRWRRLHAEQLDTFGDLVLKLAPAEPDAPPPVVSSDGSAPSEPGLSEPEA